MSRRSEEDMEDKDAHAEEEQPGELPKMMKNARNERLKHKIHSHQMKELQEERLKMGQSMEGFLQEFQANQTQMLELEKQVELLKAREAQKATEIKRWQSSSDTLQKDSLRLKRQLAVVTERLAKAEESAASVAEAQQSFDESAGARSGGTIIDEQALEESARLAVEQLQMRLADYEALVVEFADQASKLTDETDLEPMDLSGQFEEGTLPPEAPLLPLGSFGEEAPGTDTAENTSAGSAVARADEQVRALRSKSDQVECEMQTLSVRCCELEESANIAKARCTELQVQIDSSEAESASKHAAVEGADAQYRETLSELKSAQAQCSELEADGAAARARYETSKAELQVELARRTSQLQQELDDAMLKQEEEAKLRADLQEELTQRTARLEQEVHSARRQAEADGSSKGDLQAELAQRASLLERELEAATRKQDEEAKLRADLQDELAQRTSQLEQELEASRCNQEAHDSSKDDERAKLAQRSSQLQEELDVAFHKQEVEQTAKAEMQREFSQSIARLEQELEAATQLQQVVSSNVDGVDQDVATQLRAEAASSLKKCTRAEADLQSVRTEMSVAVQGEADAKQLSLVLQGQRMQAERNGLKAMRRIQAADILLNAAHSQIQRLTSRSSQGTLPGKRESRRHQSEMVLAHALLKSGHKVAGETAQSEGQATIAVDGGEANGEEAEPQISMMLSAAEAVAYKEQIGQLHKKIVELEQCRTQALSANAKVVELQWEAAESRAALKQAEANRILAATPKATEENDSSKEYMEAFIATEMATFQGRLATVQDHLDEEIEHFDVLAAAHEEVLIVSEKLKVEKTVLEQRLRVSDCECTAVRQELEEAISSARAVISRLHDEKHTEVKQLSESFQSQLQVRGQREQEVADTLLEERKAHADLQLQAKSRVENLEREREAVAQQKLAATQQLEHLTKERASLEEGYARARGQAETFCQDLTQARAEHQELQAKIAQAASALDKKASECQALQSELQESQLSARQQCEKIEQQMRDDISRVQQEELLRAEDAASAASAAAAAADRDEAQTQISSFVQQLSDAESANLAVEAQLQDALQKWTERGQLLASESAELRSMADEQQVSRQHLGEMEQQLTQALQDREQVHQALALEQQASVNKDAEIASISQIIEQGNQSVKQELVERNRELTLSYTECCQLKEQFSLAEQTRQGTVTELGSLTARITELNLQNQMTLQDKSSVDARLVETEQLHSTLEAKYMGLRQELEQTSQSSGGLTEELSDYQAKLRTAQSEVDALRASSEAESSLAAQVSQQNVTLQGEAVRAKADIECQEALAQQVLAAQQAQHASELEIALGEQTKQHAADREQAIAANTDQLKQQMQAEAQKYMTAVTEQARVAVVARDERIGSLSTQLQETSTRLQEVSNQLIQSQQQQALQAQDAGNSSEQRLAEANVQISVACQERDALQQQVSNAAAEFQQASAQRETLQIQIQGLGSQLAEVQQLLSDKEVQFEMLLAQHAKEGNALAAQGLSEQQLAAEKQDLADKLSATESQLSILNEARSTMQQELASRHYEMNEVSFERDGLYQQVEDMNSQLVQLQHQLTGKETEVEVLNTERSNEREALARQGALEQQLVAETQTLSDKLAVAESQVSMLSTSKDTLQQELASSQYQINEMSLENNNWRQQMEGVGAQITELQQQLMQKEGQVEMLNAERSRQLETASSSDQQFAAENQSLTDKMLSTEAQVGILSGERVAMQQQLDNLLQQLSIASSAEAPRQNAMRDQEAKLEDLSRQLMQATSDRNSVTLQLEQARSALASGSGLESTLTVELEETRKRLQATSAEHSMLQQRLEGTGSQLSMVTDELETLRKQSQDSDVQLGVLHQHAQEQDRALEAVRFEFATATSSKVDMEKSLSETAHLLEAAVAHRDALSVQLEEAHAQQLAAAVAATPPLQPGTPPPVAAVVPPAFEAEQAVAEREALEVAFRMQMEEVQRSLSAKTMEAETLRHQLAQATTGPSAPSTAPVPTLPGQPGELAEERWQAQFRRMQLRISAVEEEKAMMLKDMRDHIMVLARENYDLKQGGQSSEPPKQEAMAGGSRDAAGGGPAASAFAAPSAAGEAASAGEAVAAGGWLSYVLAPFLTDSDMREIHAEAVVDEALRGQPLLKPAWQERP